MSFGFFYVTVTAPFVIALLLRRNNLLSPVLESPLQNINLEHKNTRQYLSQYPAVRKPNGNDCLIPPCTRKFYRDLQRLFDITQKRGNSIATTNNNMNYWIRRLWTIAVEHPHGETGMEGTSKRSQGNCAPSVQWKFNRNVWRTVLSTSVMWRPSLHGFINKATSWQMTCMYLYIAVTIFFVIHCLLAFEIVTKESLL